MSAINCQFSICATTTPAATSMRSMRSRRSTLASLPIVLLLLAVAAATLVPVTNANVEDADKPHADESVSKLRGESATLTCPIDVTACGVLHSLKWFKGRQRVAVVSGDGSVQNIESDLGGKMTIDHKGGASESNLNIKSVQVPDEDVYSCETTFLEPLEGCNDDGTYGIEFLVNVPPTTIQMLDESGNIILNATTLSPLREGHRFISTCEVRNTRPAPQVGWYRSGIKLQSDTPKPDESVDGLYTAKSVLSLELSRLELDSFLECRVETPALENAVSNHIHIDLQVRPTKVELSGVKHHTVQGTNILLKCTVSGARPAANVTWYNNTLPLDPAVDSAKRVITTRVELKNDGTFETTSKMEFTATRFENGISIRCEADNLVMWEDSDKPIHDTMMLEVMYPPVVSVKPDNLTVKENGEFLLFCEYEANPASLKQVRWLKDGELISLNQTRVEGGNPEQTALLIKQANRHDIGSYTCELENGIDTGVSANDIDVDVHFAPLVEVVIEPDVAVVENDEMNVTLTCAVTEGNPNKLIGVRWFLDGVLLSDVPSCNKTAAKVDGKVVGEVDDGDDNDDDENDDEDDNDDDDNDDDDDDDEDDCGVLVLVAVDRNDWGNYSCEGLNSAGWGPRSDANELEVYFEPGNATLQHQPLVAIKKKSVTLSCSVEDGGNPNATRYRWQRGDTNITDVVTPTWTIDPVGLESRTNFTCFAYNDGGHGANATVQLDVHAPQSFVQKLPPMTGALFSAKEVRMACQVECVPNCTISWSVNGRTIDDENEEAYSVDTKDVAANPLTGDFESVLSVLSFNMSAWPEGELSEDRDNANYTCESSSVVDGPGVRSTTAFSVEYPPKSTVISNTTINVEEGLQPPRVSCSSNANPEPTYEWRRKDRIISKNSVLIITQDMTRADDGMYFCDATNKHGTHSAMTEMHVLYKPNCTITRKEINDEDTLVCMANGNPSSTMEFAWSMQDIDSNETVSDLPGRDSSDNLPANFLVLDADSSTQRTYRCVATNSVGTGNQCEIKVDGYLMWWQQLEPLMFYLLLAAIVFLVLLIIILIIVCCCCCRKGKDGKKKADVKSPASLESIDIQDDGEYENLPFHGMQSAPNKPLCMDEELEYADVDFRSYGPINYKAASIYALVKKNKGGTLLEK